MSVCYIFSIAQNALSLSLASSTSCFHRLSDNQDNDLFVDRLVEVKDCYEFGSSDKIVNAKGKLRENVGFYQSIGALDFVLSIIRNGYRLPFVNFPESVILPNNRSVRGHSSFVDEALLELLSSGRVIQVADAPLSSILYLYQFSLAGRRG